MATLACSPNQILNIAGINLSTPAWIITDLSDLLKTLSRGDNAVIPGVNGSRAFPKRPAQVRMQFPMTVIGDVNSAGTPYGNPALGLITNLLFLKDNLGSPVAPPATTQLATWFITGGTNRTAQVQIVSFDVDYAWRTVATCTLEIDVPAGRFV